MSLTTGRARHLRNPRGQIDRKAVRHFIYRLHDARGDVIYVGRSSQPVQRIRAHIKNAEHSDPTQSRSREWVFDARSVSMVGPFTWDDACRVERREIEKHQPRGNRMFTAAHGWPKTA